MNIRNRVKEIITMRLGDLRPNPRNWRTHPDAQANTLKGILSEIGWAGAVLAYDPGDGAGLMMIDGHLRADTAGDMDVPVVVLDVTQAEADYLLATTDPIAAMAGANAEALESLIGDIETRNAAVKAMLDELAAGSGIDFEFEGEGAGASDHKIPKIQCIITIPAKVWLSQKPDFVGAVEKCIREYGGVAEWPD